MRIKKLEAQMNSLGLLVMANYGNVRRHATKFFELRKEYKRKTGRYYFPKYYLGRN